MDGITRPDWVNRNYDFAIAAESTQPRLEWQLQNEDGSYPDLTNATVQFVLTEPESGDTVVESDAVVTDAESGKVAYEWDASDTSDAGVYNGEFVVQYQTGTETFPTTQYITVSIEP